jgi:hypothetical protein
MVWGMEEWLLKARKMVGSGEGRMYGGRGEGGGGEGECPWLSLLLPKEKELGKFAT